MLKHLSNALVLAVVGAVPAIAQVRYGAPVPRFGQGAWMCAQSGLLASQSQTCPIPWTWTTNPAGVLQEQARQAAKDKAVRDAQQRAQAENAALEKQRQDEAAAEKRREAEAAKTAVKTAAAEKLRQEAAAKAADKAALAAQREAAQHQEHQHEVLVAQEATDAERGYKHVTVADIMLDFADMSEGTKLVLTGYHSHVGQLESLSDGTLGDFVYLDSRELTRETRLADLRCDGQAQRCLLTIWAHTGCTMQFAGKETSASCLIIDALRPGPYAVAPEPDRFH